MLRIHRYWNGDPDPAAGWTATAISATCRGTLTEWDLGALIGAGLLAADEATGDHRHVANIARYALLHRYGGLWLDHDLVPLGDLTAELDPWVAGVGSRPEGFAMWFPEPGHPALAAILDELRTMPGDGPAPARSGAQVLAAHVARHQVAVRPDLAPLDSTGRVSYRGRPLAIHLWATSREVHDASSG